MKDRDYTRPRHDDPKELSARNRRIASAMKSGISLRVLRERFGMGEDTIKHIAAQHGVMPRRPGRP